ncbi:hypothetical protein CTAYLR_001787 [Chrysophaeum taylorii]|uniref:PNPLA domain-containing protein n=1 Tax=Chrysophaeum taylorii TaxID=2483200 RepID=A0AAD7UG99_9STRA|nr:hypothetical protein CTAYLR_001787 [Chrysophaeum taylorii]
MQLAMHYARLGAVVAIVVVRVVAMSTAAPGEGALAVVIDSNRSEAAVIPQEEAPPPDANAMDEEQEDDESAERVMVFEGRLRSGEGWGVCLGAKEGGRVSVVVSRLASHKRNATSRGLLPRVRSSRDHCYCGVFALDERRDAVGSPAMVSTRKLRQSESLRWCREVPEQGTVHVLVASNSVDEEVESGYAVEVRSEVELVEMPGDGRGRRGPVVGEPVASSRPPRRLLCLDGGGARGVVPLAVLARLEKLGSRRARERFDFFAGTSTGAIIAAALAIAELPVPVVQQLYDDIARLIFGSRGLSRGERADRLRAVLSSVFGPEARLLDDGPDTSRPRCVLVATDASTQRLRPALFRNYRLPENDDDDDQSSMLVVDALLASTAAPPFFPARQFDHKRLLDGALVANNPTLFALVESAALGRDSPELVVSLGTGSAPYRATRTDGIHSHIDFFEGLFNLITDTDATHDLVKRHLHSKRRHVKPTRYHRLDAFLDASHLRLDEGDERALRALRAMALDYLQREKTHDWDSLVREFRGVPDDDSDDLTALYDIDEVPYTPSTSWLRPLRKRAARITGMHGFFSGKPKHTILDVDPPASSSAALIVQEPRDSSTSSSSSA